MQIILFLAGLAAVGLLIRVTIQWWSLLSMKLFAKAHELTYERRGPQKQPRVIGRIDDVLVSVVRDGAVGQCFFTVRHIHAADISLTPRSYFEGARTHEGEPEITTGDSEFDREVVVRGTVTDALIVLDTAHRALLQPALSAGVTVDAGRLIKTVSLYVGQGELDELLADLQPLADALTVDQEQRLDLLVQRFQDEPNLALRRRILACIISESPKSLQTLDASRSVLNSPDFGLALIGACALKGEGQEVLLALAQNNKADLATRRGAVRALAEQGAIDQLIAIIKSADSRPILPELLDAFVRTQSHQALPAIIEHLERKYPPKEHLRARISKSLSQLNTPVLQDWLSRRLDTVLADNGRLIEADRIALQTLGAVGDARHLDALDTLTEMLSAPQGLARSQDKDQRLAIQSARRIRARIATAPAPSEH